MTDKKTSQLDPAGPLDGSELVQVVQAAASKKGLISQILDYVADNLSTSDITEGANLYYTAARFNAAFAGKTTSGLAEGANLYYTAARFNAAFAAKSTTDLAEGANLYYTDVRVDARLTVQKGAPNGIASLDVDGKIPTNQLPPLAISDTFVVVSQAAQTALSAERGDVAVRNDINKSYILTTDDPTIFGNWQELLTPTDSVLSVNGFTGTVTLTTNNIAEGANLYYTAARFDTAFAAKSTTNLAEGTNLYYTAARFNTAFAAKSTTDLAEGTNLYFTNERVDDRVAALILNGTGLAWTYNDGGNTLTGDVSLAPFTTGNLTEGANLYYTAARFNAAFAGKSTTDLTEGTNLYYTAARFNAAFAGKTTTDLTEGTNLYYTTARVDAEVPIAIHAAASKTTPVALDELALIDSAAAFGLKKLTWANLKAAITTTDIAEGANLYYTVARFNTAFAAKSTTDLAEGTNLYYTAARFNTAFAAKSTTDLAEGANLYYTAARFNTAFAAKSTTDLAEGANLYYTNARVDAEVPVVVHAAASKATPVDADELALIDSAASNGLKKLTWANLKATLSASLGDMMLVLTASSAGAAHNHQSFLTFTEASQLIDGTVPSVVKTSSVVAGHSHSVTWTWDATNFVFVSTIGSAGGTPHVHATGHNTDFSNEFISTDQTITSAGALTISHGLTGTPHHIHCYLVNVNAEAGYTAGQIAPLEYMRLNANEGVSIVPDATNLNIRFGSNAAAFAVVNKTTGVTTDITNANWHIRFYAKLEL